MLKFCAKSAAICEFVPSFSKVSDTQLRLHRNGNADVLSAWNNLFVLGEYVVAMELSKESGVISHIGSVSVRSLE